ncbi:VirB3 family type IV secretion system protein [Arsenophonus nasoniae]|uniref:VirB3 family type IV secretion system protein n=1 Tax=Arsenophonus nasoniae TaxID=638 RepID=A0AA95GBD9_9GAMM|nr:VirB3 family type IV secretion system protein [Arsenophonus nasoniae]WGL94025.1 VirB3 family type IV secretion system protein [Arsenophonus nasoniae]
MSLDDEYLTYNGFNRAILFWGVPLIPFIICLSLIMVTFITGVLLMGFYGVIVPIIILAFLLLLKQRCSKDPNAVKVDSLKFKGFALKGFSNKIILKVI